MQEGSKQEGILFVSEFSSNMMRSWEGAHRLLLRNLKDYWRQMKVQLLFLFLLLSSYCIWCMMKK